MGKVDSFEVPGCNCVFYSNDHPPPHFHVKSPGEWEMRVFFLEDPPRCEMKFEVTQIAGRVRRQVSKLAADNREALFIEWCAKVQARSDDHA